MTALSFGLAVENFAPADRAPDIDVIVAYGHDL